MSLFQSNLRKQIRNLPKILNFVKIIQYYSKIFTGVLNEAAVLDALRTRYFAGKIASTVAPMLVVLNPYEALDDRAATARR